MNYAEPSRMHKSPKEFVRDKFFHLKKQEEQAIKRLASVARKTHSFHKQAEQLGQSELLENLQTNYANSNHTRNYDVIVLEK